MITARGRNGNFKLAKTSVWEFDNELWVELFSKKQSGHFQAPVYLKGDASEIIEWAENLIKKIERESTNLYGE